MSNLLEYEDLIIGERYSFEYDSDIEGDSTVEGQRMRETGVLTDKVQMEPSFFRAIRIGYNLLFKTETRNIEIAFVVRSEVDGSPISRKDFSIKNANVYVRRCL